MTTNLFTAFGAFCAAEGLEAEVLGNAFRSDPAAREALIAFEEGRLEDDAFALALAATLGLPPERAEGLIDGLMAGASLETDMVDMVRRARAAGIKTAMVSNSWGADRYPREVVEELFDATVISGIEGFRKPDPRMYLLGAERVGLPPEACVFVDDLPFNLKPAAELGMATVLHGEPGATIGRLEVLLGLPLRAA
ncbi:HAD-IA family hydrolase [Baekduia sp. Peel2402]|uniref:HAD-IA family hydrolase n=1 Tax=Baekduia sp. Peel2402 TaxID=3458296 RepID=UPI00403E7125